MTTPHLEPASMASYIDGWMSQAERNRAEEHLADCPECRELLAGAVRTLAELDARLLDDINATNEPRPLRRAAAGAAIAALVVAILVMVVWP